MRRWSVVIAAVYAAILMILVLPIAVVIANNHSPFWSGVLSDVRDVSEAWETWVWAGALIGGQCALLFLSVDVSPQRLKPRTHILLTLVVSGVLLLMLVAAGGISLAVGVLGEDYDRFYANAALTIGVVVTMWVLWGVIFHFHTHRTENGTRTTLQKSTDWLFRASVLELLVAVPSHVFVRRRQECCAPGITSLGIATGIAVMLLSFGPSVLLLYKKRIDDHKPRMRRQAVPQEIAGHS